MGDRPHFVPPRALNESRHSGLAPHAQQVVIAPGERYQRRVPGNFAREGPFGEFTGYYGRPEARTPIIDIQRVRMRKNPIMTCALMADYPSNEQSGFF